MDTNPKSYPPSNPPEGLLFFVFPDDDQRRLSSRMEAAGGAASQGPGYIEQSEFRNDGKRQRILSTKVFVVQLLFFAVVVKRISL